MPRTLPHAMRAQSAIEPRRFSEVLTHAGGFLLHLLGLVIGDQSIDERLYLAVHHRVQLVDGEADAVIGDPVLQNQFFGTGAVAEQGHGRHQDGEHSHGQRHSGHASVPRVLGVFVQFLQFARNFNQQFPGFDTDIHGLVETSDAGKLRYYVDCVRPK